MVEEIEICFPQAPTDVAAIPCVIVQQTKPGAGPLDSLYKYGSLCQVQHRLAAHCGCAWLQLVYLVAVAGQSSVKMESYAAGAKFDCLLFGEHLEILAQHFKHVLKS